MSKIRGFELVKEEARQNHVKCILLPKRSTKNSAIIRGFTESCEDEELKENLKEQMREALEMNFETAFKMSDGETFEEASRSMEEAVLKAMKERWKS